MNNYNIFFIDDNVRFLESAVNYLNDLNEVESIGWGLSYKASQKNIERFSPNLVLVDLSMPETNGIEATKLLKNNPNPPKVYVVSFNDDDSSIQEAMAAGADGFISKHNFVDDINNLIHN